MQLYLAETAQCLVHGLTQAFMKRGLPRALLTDNGAAMLAEETRNGLSRLGIAHKTTLPYSPYQNGKQEAFWAQLEGRLMKITRPEKLRNFIKMAGLRGDKYLRREAMKKMALYREVAAA